MCLEIQNIYSFIHSSLAAALSWSGLVHWIQSLSSWILKKMSWSKTLSHQQNENITSLRFVCVYLLIYCGINHDREIFFTVYCLIFAVQYSIGIDKKLSVFSLQYCINLFKKICFWVEFNSTRWNWSDVSCFVCACLIPCTILLRQAFTSFFQFNV